MHGTFFQFAYLQVLDFLSTAICLMGGSREGNPLVGWIMDLAETPLEGLAIVKCISVGVGVVCVVTKRDRLLAKVNWVYAGVVVWNLCSAIVLLAYRR